MDMRIVTGMIALALLAASYWVEKQFESNLPAEYLKGPEARSWLRTNESDAALASNRFSTTREAARFVARLYDAGATRVVVPQLSIQDEEGESYADALVVTLPTDPEKRDRVQRLCADEIKREGGDPDDFINDDHAFLWWD